MQDITTPPSAVPLRAFELGELLDGAFTLYRRNFTALFGIAFLVNLPLIVVWLAAPLLAPAGAAGDPAVELASIVALPYSLLAMLLMLGALTAGAWAAYAGNEVEIGAAIATGGRRILAVGLAVAITWTLVFLGLLLLIVPGLILLAGFFAVVPAAVVENRGAIGSMSRSRTLARGGRPRILATLALTYLITVLPVFAISLVAGVGIASGLFATIPADALESSWGIGVVQALTHLVSALTYPFFALVTVLLYVDRRARTEAPDLEAALSRLAAGG